MITEITIVINNGNVAISRTEGDLDAATLAGVLRYVADQYDPPAEETDDSPEEVLEEYSYSLN